jgi:DNA-binding GntR family transcriptional regulator
MTTPKRKIKVKPFVSDLRNGMGDRELMEKYTVSEHQLHKAFQRLIDAGVIDEMELFMRTSLSDSTMTKAFVDTIKERDNFEETTPSRDLETPSNISITQKLNTTSNVFRRMLSKLPGTGS